MSNPPAHSTAPRQPRWAAASADFIEGLRAERTGDPLLLLAHVFAAAADAEQACVVGPRSAAGPDGDLFGGDAGAEVSCVVHAAHERSARERPGSAFPAAASLCGPAFATGRPFLVSGGDSETAAPESLLNRGPTLVVPLQGARVSGRPTLVLTASRLCGAPPFTDVDLESAAAFARLAHAGLRLERSGEDRARLAVISDRDRIARDLHDRVIQQVFAAGLAVQSLGAMTTDLALGRRLADQVGALDAVIVEIRTAIFALSLRANPDRPGIRRRILDLLDELGPLFVHPPQVVFSGTIDLLVAVSLADDVVAVVREGLTNVVRHAGIRDAAVRVSVAADILTIEVGDIGVGLSGSSRCSGLANLSARAERWQGTVSLTDRAPSGALLRWTARLTESPERATR